MLSRFSALPSSMRFISLSFWQANRPPAKLNLLTCQVKHNPEEKRSFDLISRKFLLPFTTCAVSPSFYWLPSLSLCFYPLLLAIFTFFLHIFSGLLLLHSNALTNSAHLSLGVSCNPRVKLLWKKTLQLKRMKMKWKFLLFINFHQYFN